MDEILQVRSLSTKATLDIGTSYFTLRTSNVVLREQHRTEACLRQTSAEPLIYREHVRDRLIPIEPLDLARDRRRVRLGIRTGADRERHRVAGELRVRPVGQRPRRRAEIDELGVADDADDRDRRVRADADREREDGDDREAGRAKAQTQREADVLQKRVHVLQLPAVSWSADQHVWK